MRKILLSTAALVLATGTALAVEPVQSTSFTVQSTLAASCSIGSEDTTVDVGPAAEVVGTADFSTTCNFEDQEMTLTFASVGGGLANEDEVGVLKDYTIGYGVGNTKLASLATLGDPLSVAAPAGPTANDAVPRQFTVTLVSDIVIAGDYSDTVVVAVAP